MQQLSFRSDNSLDNPRHFLYAIGPLRWPLIVFFPLSLLSGFFFTKTLRASYSPVHSSGHNIVSVILQDCKSLEVQHR